MGKILNFKTYWLLLAIVINFFYSCYPEDKVDCKVSKDWGGISLSDSTKQFLQLYQNKTKVYFKDSLGKESVFIITNVNQFNNFLDLHIAEKGCPEARFTAQLENSISFLTSNSLKINLKLNALIGIAAHYDYLLKDEILYCSSSTLTDTTNRNLLLEQYIMFDNKFIFGTVGLKDQTLSLFGKTYTKVISQNNNCYLQRQVGILAFRDLDKRLWVFDRFE